MATPTSRQGGNASTLLATVTPLARCFAARYARRSEPNRVEADDLVQVGLTAALELVPDYDPARSTFKTFAADRVRGAILDYVRNNSTFNRVARRLRDRGRTVPLFQSQQDVHDVPVYDRAIDDATDDGAAVTSLLRFLGVELSVDEAHAMRLRYAGATCREIGRELGGGEWYAWKLLQTIHARIRAALLAASEATWRAAFPRAAV